MKRFYLALTIVVVISAVIALIFMTFNSDIDTTCAVRDRSDVYLDDEEYLIYPSDSTDKWNIVFPSDDLYVDLKPEQIALFLKSGEIPKDTTWVIYPQCEYQLTMEDNYILIEDFGRPIGKIPYNKAGDIGKLLLKDNE
jgi:hypothetical protein